jgi:hypothetical protein
MSGQAISALRGTEKDGLQLGTQKQVLLNKHPRMLQISNGAQPAGSLSSAEVYSEAVPNPEGRTGLFYFFKDDVLRAVSVTRGFAPGQESRSQKYLSDIYGHLAETMSWVANEDVLRSNGLEGFVVTAERWKSKTDGTELYFVATNQEVTTVQFDPKYLGRKDLLADPEWKAKVDENGRRLRAKIPPEVLERDAKKMGNTGITDAPRPFDPRSKGVSPKQGAREVNLDPVTMPMVDSKEDFPNRSIATRPFPNGGIMPWLSLGAVLTAAVCAVLWLKKKRKG